MDSIIQPLQFRELCELLRVEPAQSRALLQTLPDPSLGHRSPVDRLRMRAILTERGFRYEPQTLACMNLKGGVGKTTSCVSIASRAVQYGFRTCVIDLDAQASATLALGIEPDDDLSIFHDVWRDPESLLASALIHIDEGLSLLPSSLENSLLDVSLSNPAAQKGSVAAACAVLRELGFDLIVIDCPPSLGAGVISTVCAADQIIIPAAGDAFSMRGIKLTIQEVGAIRETFGLSSAQLHILPTMVDRRQKLSVAAVDTLTAEYGATVLPGVIRTSTLYARALQSRNTVFTSARKSPAKDDYDKIVSEILGITACLAQQSLRTPATVPCHERAIEPERKEPPAPTL